jgi:membrane-associated protease RseP (regulator of RpoE activity)
VAGSLGKAVETGGKVSNRSCRPSSWTLSIPPRILPVDSARGAGPLSNLVLFGFFRLAQLGASSPALFRRIAEINLDLAMFNLMPMSYLDGARLALTIGMSEASRRRLQKIVAAFLFLTGAVCLGIALAWKFESLHGPLG